MQCADLFPKDTTLPEPLRAGADLRAGFWGHLWTAGAGVSPAPHLCFLLASLSWSQLPPTTPSRLTEATRLACPGLASPLPQVPCSLGGGLRLALGSWRASPVSDRVTCYHLSGLEAAHGPTCPSVSSAGPLCVEVGHRWPQGRRRDGCCLGFLGKTGGILRASGLCGGPALWADSAVPGSSWRAMRPTQTPSLAAWVSLED